MKSKKRNPAKLEKKTIPQLRKRLGPLFKDHIKQLYSEDGYYCSCYTCGKSLAIGSQDCQGGHFLPEGSYSATQFDLRNVRPQCIRCNLAGCGMPVEYERHLIEEIGADEVADLKALSTQKGFKWDRFWLIEQIEHYQELAKS